MKTLEQVVEHADSWNGTEGFGGTIRFASGQPDSLGFHAVEHLDEDEGTQTCYVCVKLLDTLYRNIQMMEVKDSEGSTLLEARGDVLARFLMM